MNYAITKIRLREIKIPFRFNFSHASSTRNEANSFIVEVHSEDGTIGYGEILTRPYLTGETSQSVREDFRQRLWPQAKELNFGNSLSDLTPLSEMFAEADEQRKMASFAGLDIAVHDLWGKLNNVKGCDLAEPCAGKQNITVPIDQNMPIVLIAQLAKRSGFVDYKIKVGFVNDSTRVRDLRSSLGDQFNIRIDANEAWSANEACSAIKTLEDANISSVEQPVAAADFEGMAKVRESCNIAVMADESLCTTSDAKKLINVNGADIWNLRLAKNGGFTGIKEFIKIADQNQIETQLGVLVGETALLSNAALCCLGLTSFRHIEYGFHQLLLKENPFKGNTMPWKGSVKNSIQGLGLGVNAAPPLEKYTINIDEYQ